MFESLLPVDPQPAHDFACLLAFPEWAAAETLILVDARPLDGRLFCCETRGALSRSSFLLQIGVEDRPGLCITVAGDAWPSGVLLTFEIGALVSLFATSDSGPQALSLDDFLSAPPDGTWPCPRYHGPVASAFWVGTDGGCFRILAYQPGRARHPVTSLPGLCRPCRTGSMRQLSVPHRRLSLTFLTWGRIAGLRLS